jgi:hypothetical protein
VHGDANLPETFGHASGEFETDVSRYMLGWMVGTEWYPYAVKVTDEANRDTPLYYGEYFHATKEATPFESWLAQMLDGLAKKEMEYGWQHPVALTNWPTTDPLSHPNEPNGQEDLVSVDPMHLTPTSAWSAGYYASYHIYPAYPDFLRYEERYQTYRDAKDEINPYAGYLNEMRAHHEGVQLVISEFGVPSSRAMARRGPLERNQGSIRKRSRARSTRTCWRASAAKATTGASCSLGRTSGSRPPGTPPIWRHRQNAG